jgi:hypothetical protein
MVSRQGLDPKPQLQYQNAVGDPRSWRAARSHPIGQAYVDQSDRGREVRRTLKKQVSGWLMLAASRNR